MGDLSIELNEEGVRRLLKVEAVPLLEEMGASIAVTAGDGHEVETFVGRSRARVTVRTATTEARIDEAVNRTLTRSIDAGRR